ncbi:class D beta-lactamase [Chishuiella sp.]|uniref:class D beta-lactamase n=1 Tax=Chishuiella sp. TaxID=1969467 RepID=UPI0028A59D14|nr:class D beta-lactamase [Chishuiella sp.]
MKKLLTILLFFIIGFNVNAQSNYTIENKFEEILNRSDVKGSILILDYQNNQYYSNNFNWANTGFIPASTFKIPNSIIGLELNILKDENTIFKWNGEKRAMPIWEKDLTLKEAFSLSCVPCYQELALKIGYDRMSKSLKKLNYNHMVFDKKTINNFWLTGGSKISQMEQIDFLKRLYFSKLPIKKKTHDILKNIMIREQNNEYILSGKTGWGISDDENIGWYVGYLEKDKNLYFFALNINSTTNTNMDNFAQIRIEAIKESFKILDILQK